MKLNRFTLSVVIASILMVSASSYALTSKEEATVLVGFESAVSTISSTEGVVNSAKPHKTPSVKTPSLKGINRANPDPGIRANPDNRAYRANPANRGRGWPVSPS